jgi:hypothetical protein
MSTKALPFSTRTCKEPNLGVAMHEFGDNLVRAILRGSRHYQQLVQLARILPFLTEYRLNSTPDGLHLVVN